MAPLEGFALHSPYGNEPLESLSPTLQTKYARYAAKI
jgi:hypothetical protein